MIDHTTVKITDIKVEELPIIKATKPLNNTQIGFIIGGVIIVVASVAYFKNLNSKKGRN